LKKLMPLLSILLLSACVSAPNYGVGPIELSSDQRKFYHKYLNRIKSREDGKDRKEDWVFAISPTENYARYIYKSGKRRLERAEEKALRLCNEGVENKDCKIYDINGMVVWKFD